MPSDKDKGWLDALLTEFVRRCSCQHSASRVRWHLVARAHTRSV